VSQLDKSNKIIKIDYFHDVICSWCYVLSPRLRKLVQENPNIEITHHSFALSRTKDDTIRMFGSVENAKKEIMKHWRASNIRDEEKRIHAELMESREFEYPISFEGLRGCKAAELQGGQTAHWDYFDLVQEAHLTDARNIADRDVLIDIAKKVGLNVDQFISDFDGYVVIDMIDKDIKLAKKLQVNSVPTIIINGKTKVPGAIDMESLRALIYEDQVIL